MNCVECNYRDEDQGCIFELAGGFKTSCGACGGKTSLKNASGLIVAPPKECSGRVPSIILCKDCSIRILKSMEYVDDLISPAVEGIGKEIEHATIKMAEGTYSPTWKRNMAEIVSDGVCDIFKTVSDNYLEGLKAGIITQVVLNPR